ncbi:VOC family protein [Enterovibrio norvegicus]|uniref:VOC family protein n=1 Tax=Enterovibrio norvegicus TaxID=188144 RepID=UPI000C82E3D5|nr:VOC family protein [Enterovibrio norvegicus]PML78593.1 lactoylglutathione lyase [Enterovibrio norvegicus]PMN64432.1 lactoylglutathione lyase [Enterovibrio norvegicus]
MTIFSHVTLGTNDYEKAALFYDAVLAPLGMHRVPKPAGKPLKYAKGDEFTVLYIYLPFDGNPASWGNGTHVAFLAESRDAVDAFYAQAIAKGGVDEGKPGLRENYSANYYAAYVRDLDGNKLQAVCYAEQA